MNVEMTEVTVREFLEVLVENDLKTDKKISTLSGDHQIHYVVDKSKNIKGRSEVNNSVISYFLVK